MSAKWPSEGMCRVCPCTSVDDKTATAGRSRRLNGSFYKGSASIPIPLFISSLMCGNILIGNAEKKKRLHASATLTP